ncbi:zinc finger protein 436 [Aedes aegypti]|uniref:Uncharacterized protein n=1 Tax=Aedes aegypti TaxID=7159 RepID=A0A6I8TFN4_AEDAE|nr:zinc finger protein 436 [Aedes aegypti]
MTSRECRICLRYEQNCVSLFAKRRGTSLAEMVRFCARVEISENDGLPKDACGRCVDEALNAYLFVNKCRRSDAELRTAQASLKDDNEDAETEINDQLAFCAVDVEPQHVESLEVEQEEDTADSNVPIPDVDIDIQQVTSVSEVMDTASNSDEESIQYATSDSESVEFDHQQQEVKTSDKAIQEDVSLGHMKQESLVENLVEQEEDNADQEFLIEYLDDNFKDDFTDAIQEANCLQYDVEVLEYSQTTHGAPLLICCGVRCKDVFGSIQELKEHSNVVHLPHRELDSQDKPFECSRCYTRFNSEKSLTMHSRRSQFCTLCSETFVSLNEKRLHMQNVHGLSGPVSVKQTTRRICCGCHEQFENEEDLRNHGEKVHSIRKNAVDETRPFQCNICYKLFRTFESLRIHQRFVYRPKNFVCVICGRAFDTRSKLQTHLLVHSDKRNFQCDKCSKSFKKEIDLKSHVLLHDEKREECNYCGLKFHRKSNLKMHMRKHQDTFFYACPECPKKFKNNSHLKEHFKVHSKQKPYPCSFCERSFAYCSDRKRHEMSHTGNYPFECACSKKFSRKTTYEKHALYCQDRSENEYRD